MAVRHLVSIRDVTSEHVARLVSRAVWYAQHPERSGTPLSDRVVGIYFRRTSTRTRTAFSVAAIRLGAKTVAFGPNDLQENTGESIEDTGRVLASMLDGLVARTTGPESELRTLAAQDRMAVVNAMTAEEHPTQAIADLATLQTRFGGVEGLRVLYVGEGNNTAAALALALCRFRATELHLRTPPGYGLDPKLLEEAQMCAERVGGTVSECHDMTTVPPDIDVVYTTRWQTTGTSKPSADWRERFAPFHVDGALMDACPGAVFMHDLPAHRGEEVAAGVLDGDRSIAFVQAEYKLYGAMAVLEWCINGAEE